MRGLTGLSVVRERAGEGGGSKKAGGLLLVSYRIPAKRIVACNVTFCD